MTEKTARDRTILAVFAHPDDETTTTGGTLALYASQGGASSGDYRHPRRLGNPRPGW